MTRGTYVRTNGTWKLRGNSQSDVSPPPYDPGDRTGPIAKPSASNTGPRVALTETISSTEATNRLRNTGTLSAVRITGGLVFDASSVGWVIEDCEFKPGSRAPYVIKAFVGSDYVTIAPEDRPVLRNCKLSYAASAVFYGSNTILDRCDISDGTDLCKVLSNVEIFGCYAYDLYHSDGSHCDVVQIQSGHDSLIHWNNFIGINGPSSPSAPGDYSNSVLQTGSLNGDIINIQWLDNWVTGGGYTLRGVGSTAAESSYTVEDYIFRRNKHGRGFRFGPIAYMGPRTTYDNTNVWEDTGEPIRP